LNRHAAIGGSRAAGQTVILAKVLKYAVTTFERTGQVRANMDDAFAHGLIVEEGVELEDAMNIGKRNAHRASDGSGDGF